MTHPAQEWLDASRKRQKARVEGRARGGRLDRPGKKRASGGSADDGPAVKQGSIEDFIQRDRNWGAPGELGVVAKGPDGKTDMQESMRLGANNYDDALRENFPIKGDLSARQAAAGAGSYKPAFTDKSEFKTAPEGNARGGKVKRRADGGATTHLSLKDTPPDDDWADSVPPPGGSSRGTADFMPRSVKDVEGRAFGGAAERPRTTQSTVDNYPTRAAMREGAPPDGRPLDRAERERDEGRAKGGRLTAGERQKMPSADFALPGRGTGKKGAGAGSYPIPDETHARNALARGAQHASPAELATIKRKVHAKFPAIKEG